ncbi:response regulator [Noviherbaspirillum saxi]|uniref:histidine kinase n=1 Tax=Noviherbaspirillum saxi TaxID=2320863 RepID=A0A3A3FWG4_9BURK|nr:response regulator [Noviherbaspirillum saxi]RJF98958.1 response regulator [Noviherbaspirillum saxi]
MQPENEQAYSAAASQTPVDSSALAMGNLLADMNHDIRTSMNGIVGMLELLLETGLTAAQHEYARIAQDSVDTLLQVIERIVDLSLLESNQFSLTRLPFDLLTEMREACAGKAAIAESSGLRLHIGYPQTALLTGDPARLRQVVGILIDTAIRIAERGEIRVATELHIDQAVGKLRMAVHANGPSEAGEQLTTAMNQPLRTGIAALKVHGKNAVELALCVRLARLMGGSVSVDSVPSHGANLRLLLDLPLAAACVAGTRVLLLADTPKKWTAALSTLTDAGVQIDAAALVTDGLDLLRQAAGTDAPYRIVLLEPSVGGMPADMLASAIRNEPAYAKSGLGILSNDTHVRPDAFLRQGFDAVILPAMTPAALMQSMFRLAGVAGPDTLGAAGISAPPQQYVSGVSFDGKRVLVADDNMVNQQVAMRMLEKIGCRVDIASHGNEAIEKHGATPYDLVLMDCDMPHLDGYEATARIRQLPGSAKHVPVIALTACTTQEERDRCAAAGMNDFLSKPIRPQTLKDMLARWMPRAIPNDTAMSGPAGDDELEAIRDMFGADFAELATLYRNDSPPRVAALRGAHAAGDAAMIAKVAHAFAGSSASIGATRLSVLCSELEASAKLVMPTDIDARLHEIATEYARISAKLQSLLETERT